MGKNMGTLDRTLRIIVALVLAYLAYTGALAGGLATGAYIVAAVFLLTSLIGFCPLYRVIGVNTCGKG
ncbi:hypothetical protein AMC99_00768 [Altererythrobacter epoxidivorans]|uniref:Inner membrane protein YgaP-like transmembrane domain-containing protein n=1 Tax=Altererythrobacter epoxidivorans TaxID=361183 RepID=A0A0M4LU53_9SPHN|nr:DUF2892 domain-containing protein [Altererythrobacter epoxidivorans]ALE16071.1 hypothetical protein AMC99_00768 [Altererythrobacter epoxidivorans]